MWLRTESGLPATFSAPSLEPQRSVRMPPGLPLQQFRGPWSLEEVRSGFGLRRCLAVSENADPVYDLVDVHGSGSTLPEVIA